MAAQAGRGGKLSLLRQASEDVPDALRSPPHPEERQQAQGRLTVKKLEDMTEPELKRLMNAMAGAVERAARSLNVEYPHFALVVFNDPRIAQYISNCTRDTMIEAMRETADRLERRQDVPR